MNSFLSRNSKVFDTLRLKIPVSVDSVLSADAVAEKLASLNSIRGGWSINALAISKSIDDDDDNDEELNEDEDEVFPAFNLNLLPVIRMNY